MRAKKSMTFDIRSQEVKRSVERLDDLIRAEYNATNNFLEYRKLQVQVGHLHSRN